MGGAGSTGMADTDLSAAGGYHLLKESESAADSLL